MTTTATTQTTITKLKKDLKLAQEKSENIKKYENFTNNAIAASVEYSSSILKEMQIMVEIQMAILQ